MDWRTTIRNSEGDIALGIDIHDQWVQLEEQFAGLHMLAASFVPASPTNELANRANTCLSRTA